MTNTYEEKAIDIILNNLYDSCRKNNINPFDKRLRFEIKKEYNKKTCSFHLVGSYRTETEDERLQRLSGNDSECKINYILTGV